MNEWIECNLPWYVSRPETKSIKFPNFTRQIKRKFGKTIKEYEMELFGTNDSLEIISHPNFNKDIQKLRDFKDSVWKFECAQSSYQKAVEANKRLNDDAIEKHKLLCFKVNDFCKPGVLLQVKREDNSIEEMLIGTINALGGSCDDCCDIQDNDIVIKYKVIWNG